jgi:hypothetical protein
MSSRKWLVDKRWYYTFALRADYPASWMNHRSLISGEIAQVQPTLRFYEKFLETQHIRCQALMDRAGYVRAGRLEASV